MFKVEGTKGAALLSMGVNLDYPLGLPDTLEIARDGEWETVALRGSWFTEAFEGPMSNLQRFVTGEDSALVSPVSDAIRTMAVVEACYASSAAAARRSPTPRTGRDRRRPSALLALRPLRLCVDRRSHARGSSATSCPGISSRWSRGRRRSTIAVQACQTIEETEWLLRLAAAHPFIAGVVGWVDLRADDVEASGRAGWPANRKLSASATSSRASRTTASC